MFEQKRAPAHYVLLSFVLSLIIFISAALVNNADGAYSTTYYASDYTILSGVHVAGLVPVSIQSVDSDFLVVDSVPSIASIACNPSGYGLLGSTAYVSGTTGDLMANDGVYMTFRSYRHASEYTVEIEFNGSSNLYNWTQLTWSLDGAWTTDNVAVTLQLYNYTSGAYPINGNGVISYTSSSIANTEETKNQTIAIDPKDFHDVLGNWRIKVVGVKTSATPFDFKADEVEFKPNWISEYLASTEFLFSSIVIDVPSQLDFTVVSQYNIPNVNVTIQVWNYSYSAYSTDGQAYLKYSSQGTNETKMLTIDNGPQFFVSNGNAKIRISSEMPTTRYRQEINQVKLGHFVSILPPVLAPIGSKSGNELSLLTFIATASDMDVPNQVLTFSLGPGAPAGASITTDGVFSWIPTEAQGPGNYTVRIIVSDGSSTDYEDVLITIHEVQDASQTFDWYRVLLFALPVVFGLLFILMLQVLKPEFKRKPEFLIANRRDLFSQQYGMAHGDMIGKKMLLEIEPASDYHRALSSFAAESVNNNESLVILTNKDSNLHSYFSGAVNTMFFLLSTKTSSRQQIKENEVLLPASDLSILLDAFTDLEKGESGQQVNVLFDNVSDIILRCGFEKTYEFMRFLLKAISSSGTTALFVFNPMAHDPLVSSSVRGLFHIQLTYTKNGPRLGTS